MGMPEIAPPAQRWTAAMVRALPEDGKRYEVIAGELLVTPAPSFDHQEAVVRLWARLDPYLTSHLVGRAACAPADIEFDEHTLVQPDVFVVPLVGGRRPKRWSDIETLVLAVEVLSPSTARADRTVKRRLFQRVRIPEYWIVDVEARLVERWRPDDERPEIVTETLIWQPDASALPMEIDLAGYFAEVLDEPVG